MKNIVMSRAVEIALNTMWEEERRQVQAWFNRLANWDDEPFVRENSHLLPNVPGVRVLRTTSDWRIFFSMDGDTITIDEVAKKQTIMAFGHSSSTPVPTSPESH